EMRPLSHARLAGSTKNAVGSVGYCLPNTECKIVDYTTGVELGANHEGDICGRGRPLMKGCASNHEASAEMINSEGWLRTGDIGFCDASGQLFVVDRLKE